jgi:peptide deformylase
MDIFLADPENFTIKIVDLARKVEDPSLRAKNYPITHFNRRIRTLARAMERKCAQARGVGIAAPQLGINLQICFVDLPACLGAGDCSIADLDSHSLLGRNSDVVAPLILINPQLVERSEEQSTREEGCLSIPDPHNPQACLTRPVTRPSRISLRYRNLRGKEQHLIADGFLARCCQHEIDHLQGKLFTDYSDPAEFEKF